MGINCSRCGKVIVPAPESVGGRCGITLEGTVPSTKAEADYCKQQFGKFFGKKFTLCWECYFVAMGAHDGNVVDLPWRDLW